MLRAIRKVLVWVVCLAGTMSASRAAMAQDAKAGEATFRQFCVTCHGSTGKGNGPAAAGLNPKPSDLSATSKSDADIKKIIKGGGASSGLSPAMPAWGAALSDQDISNVVAYIRSLGKK